MRFHRSVTIATGLTALFVAWSTLATAAGVAARSFVPVQEGFRASAPKVLPYAPGRILVQFTAQSVRVSKLDVALQRGAPVPGASTGIASVDGLVRGFGVTKIRRMHGPMKDQAEAQRLGVYRWYRIDVDPATDIVKAAASLARDPNVEHASPDWRAFPATVPADPLYTSNWGHNNTAQLPGYDYGGTFAHTGAGVGTPGFDASAELAWSGSQGYGSASVIIAIIDSGVDLAHPDLRLVPGWDFGDNDSIPMDDSAQPGHGTATAGIAAGVANNGIGVAGIAGGCSIMPLKAADSSGSIFFSAIDNAIYYAANNGADVISMSLGAAVSTVSSTETALQYADGQGVVVLAATGNENASVISYPAISQWVIGVGAASPCGDRKRSSSNSGELNPGVNTDPNGFTCDGERWWGSNYGSVAQDAAGAVDVIAPTILPTTDITGSAGFDAGDYDMFFNGTSCATPYAAGVCALIKSLHPTWTPAQVRAQLVGSADDVVNVESGTGWDRYSGYGMVNAAAALGLAGVPPVAAFTGGPTSGCVDLLNVSFADLSTGSITGWHWRFGDGASATVKNPSHVYTTAGVYSVTLTVSGPAGVDSVTQVDYVTAFGPPTTAFSASDTVGAVPFSVTFTDSSTGLLTTTSWNWDFGDGETSTLQNPQHGYFVAGTYTVTLIATNACGPDTLSRVGYISVAPLPAPIAAFTGAPANGCAPLAVTFTDQSSGTISSWSWDFGDSTTSTAQSPTHAYAVPDTYTVALTVTGPGGVDTMTKPAYITVAGRPTAAFGVSDTSGVAPLTVMFTDSSSGAPTGWNWDFGDAAGDTLQNTSHTYATAGTYTVTLVASNACGADTASFQIQVSTATAVTGTRPVVFALAQNYPNPFNPTTNIEYSLPKSGRATLTVYDVSGRRVETILDRVVSAGIHHAVWRAPQNLPSGVYFARLRSEGQTAMRRLVLVR